MMGDDDGQSSALLTHTSLATKTEGNAMQHGLVNRVLAFELLSGNVQSVLDPRVARPEAPTWKETRIIVSPIAWGTR